jgi:Ran GTPase-activating protein (RanGAP) involved in mRNA processing and transport
MVVVDGHDSAWLSQYRIAIGDNDDVIKLSFMHLDLSLVPWELLLLHRRKQWQTMELIDCEHTDFGLTQILALDHVQKVYISMSQSTTLALGQALEGGLRESTSLQQLHISSCTWDEASLQELQQGLQATRTLQELNLSYTTWSDDTTVSLLASGLAQNTTLQSLKLNRCRLTDAQVALLVESGLVKEDSHLEELFLGGNALQQLAMTAVAHWLSNSSSSSSLITLGLSNPYGSSGQEQQEESTQQQISYLPLLYPALSIHTSLRVLHLASNNIGDEDIDDLAQAIGQSVSILMLDLKSNVITDVGIQRLAANLPPQLEKLWLLGNAFSSPGATVLLEALQHHHTNLADLRIPTYSKLASVPALQAIQQQIHYYEVLNRGGRRILTATAVPLGLWSLILARVNGLDYKDFGRSYLDSVQRSRVEIIYVLLRDGPALLER